MRKLLVLALCAFVLSPILANAQLSPADTGLTQTGDAANYEPAVDVGTFLGERIIQPALGFVGIIFLVLTIYSGFLWMTAGGNPEQVAKAKRILVASIIGAIIIIGAFAITTTIFSALTGEAGAEA